MTIAAAARRARVSWATWTAVERGHPGASLSTLCAIGEAVGIDLVVRAYPGAPPSLRDTGQLELARAIVDQAHASWQSEIELMVGPHGRAIDLAGFGPTEILAMEIERMVVDFQAQYRRANEKREMLSARHQRPVRLVLVIEDTRRNRTAIAPHLDLITQVLPAGSREVLRALRLGHPLGRDGVMWLRRSKPSAGS